MQSCKPQRMCLQNDCAQWCNQLVRSNWVTGGFEIDIIDHSQHHGIDTSSYQY